jgi:hypothetical protein
MCSHSVVSQHFMEPEGSLPRTQELSTCTYPEPRQSSPYHTIPSLNGYTLLHRSFSSSISGTHFCYRLSALGLNAAGTIRELHKAHLPDAVSILQLSGLSPSPYSLHFRLPRLWRRLIICTLWLFVRKWNISTERPPTFTWRWVQRGQRGGSPTAVNISFLDRTATSISSSTSFILKRLIGPHSRHNGTQKLW